MSTAPPLDFVKTNNYSDIEAILSGSISDSNKSEIKIIPYDDDEKLNDIAKNLIAHNHDPLASKKIDLLSVGASPTPHNKSQIKKFLLSFGLDEESAIRSIASACEIPMFGGKNVFSAKIISDTIVIDDDILYSTNPLWVSNMHKDDSLNFIKDIGAVTRSQIQELPSYHGGETFFQDIIFKKIFQDLLVSAINTGCLYVSIYPFEGKYRITSSNGMYSFNSDNVFSNVSMFDNFIKYIMGVRLDEIMDDIPFDIPAMPGSSAGDKYLDSKSSERDGVDCVVDNSVDQDGKFLIDFEINDRIIKIIVEYDTITKSISFELVYKPISNLSVFDNFSLPPSKELYSDFTILSYEKSLTKDFLLSELAKELPKDGIPLFVYDELAVSDWFSFKLRYSDSWIASSKVSQADIIICSFNNDNAIASMADIVMTGKPVILIIGGVSTLDSIKKVRTLQPLNIDSRLSTAYHFTVAPTTCPYCSKTKILQQPKKISTFIEPNVFLPDSTEFIARNSNGCDKCSFGMTEVLTFSEKLSMSPNLVESLSQDGGRDDELIQKHSDSYSSSTKYKLKAVLNKTIDPDDL